MNEEELLLHYGVKGMKWGVRRKRKTGSRESRLAEGYVSKGMNQEQAAISARKRAKLEKALAITAGVAITAAVSYGVYKHVGDNKLRGYLKSTYDVPDSIFNKKMSDLDDTDLFLPKGTSLHRMSTSKTLENSDMSYMSYTKKDVNRYRAIYSMINAKAEKYYDIKLESVSDIKAPSKRKQVDTMAKLLKDDDFVKGLESMKFKYGSVNDQIRGIIDTDGPESAAKSLFPLFANSLGSGTDNPAVKKFLDEVKTQGYNALIDTNDQALKISDSPLISLSPDIDVVQKNSKKVGKLMRMVANRKL